MMKMRGASFNSAAGKLQAQREAEQVLNPEKILPPDYLEDNPLTVAEFDRWDAHISSRSDWTQSELITLHRLVRIESQLEDLIEGLVGELPVVEDSKGQSKANPAYLAFNTMAKLVMSMNRQLGLDTNRNSVTRRKYKQEKLQEGEVKGQSGRGKKKKPSKKQEEKKDPANLIRMPGNLL